MEDIHELQITDMYHNLIKKLKIDLDYITIEDVKFLEAIAPAIKMYEWVLHADDHLKDTACYNCKWKSALTPSCYNSHIQGKKECEWYEDR